MLVIFVSHDANVYRVRPYSVLPIGFVRLSSVCGNAYPSPAVILHQRALLPTRRLTWILALFDFGNNQLKRLANILVIPRARFSPRTLELLANGFAVFGADLSLFGSEVGFVSYNDDRYPVGSLVECVR